MLKLRYATPDAWIETVLADFGTFLQDHAANERKVSASAMTLITQHPTHTELCEGLIEVAREELDHFQQVYALLRGLGLSLAQDVPDPYMGALMRLLRKRDKDEYLLDRLIVFGMVEARGCERFGLVAQHHPDPELARFYTELERSEARHHGLYGRLARRYFPEALVSERADTLLDAEAALVAELPARPALH